jgi:hypothetical protein
MNTEELRMILDTVKQVADTAGTAGIVWVCLHYFVQLAGIVAGPLAWALGIGLLAKHAASTITNLNNKPNATEIERTRRAEIEAQSKAAQLQAQAEESKPRKQIEEIAKAAGVQTLAHGELYSTDLNKITAKLKS